MGGPVPLGYDVKDRKLIVNESEADLVRHIFIRATQRWARTEAGRGPSRRRPSHQAAHVQGWPRGWRRSIRPRHADPAAVEPHLSRRDRPQGHSIPASTRRSSIRSCGRMSSRASRPIASSGVSGTAFPMPASSQASSTMATAGGCRRATPARARCATAITSPMARRCRRVIHQHGACRRTMSNASSSTACVSCSRTGRRSAHSFHRTAAMRGTSRQRLRLPRRRPRALARPMAAALS